MRLISLLLLLLALAFPAHAATPCCGGYNLGAAYTGQVATGSYVASTFTTNTQVMSRTLHFVTQLNGLTSFKLDIGNFFMNANNSESGNTNSPGVYPSITVRASIEYPVGSGTCTQVTFSSSSTGTVPTGTPHLLSDAINVLIPFRAQFAVRLYEVGGSGLVYRVYGTNLNPSNLNAANWGSSITDQTTSCTPVIDNGIALNLGYVTPFAIVGTTTQPSLCMVGDSIIDDIAQTFDATNDAGFVGASVAASYAFINMGNSGTSAQEWSSSSNTTQRQHYYAYCSTLMDSLGSNDLVTGTSAATTEGYLQTLYGLFSAIAASPGNVERTTIIPRTTSTDNWATTTNQTLPSWEAQRVQLNSDIRAVNFYTGNYSDTDQVLGTGANFGYWQSPQTSPACNKTQGSGNYWTNGDGTHPNQCGTAQLYISGVINMAHIHR